MMLIYFAIDSMGSGISVVRIIVAALLVSNLRATWIAGGWKTNSEDAALPPRFGDTFFDRFADKWPAFIWPKLNVVYYIFSVGFLAVVVAGLIILWIRGGHF